MHTEQRSEQLAHGSRDGDRLHRNPDFHRCGDRPRCLLLPREEIRYVPATVPKCSNFVPSSETKRRKKKNFVDATLNVM